MTDRALVVLGEVLAEAKPGFACGDDTPDGVFQVRMNNITSDGRLDYAKKRRVPVATPKLDAFQLRPGDVLFNATNSPDLVGKSAYFPGHSEPVVFSNHFLRLRPLAGTADGRFIARWLHVQFQRGVLRGLCRRWVNQAAISREALLNLRMPLPPMPQQRRIAEVLDLADVLRSTRRAALAQLDALAQSIFIDMFGDPTYNPRGWPTRQLREVVRQGTIVTYGIVQAGDEFPGGVPYIRTGDITGGKIAVGNLRRTDPETAKRFSRSRVDTGDIVMSIRATVGTTALVPPELHGANLTQGTARIAPGPSVSGQYLLAHLRTPGTQHWLSQQIKGATFREITLARLRQLPVAVPPLGLQQDFCHRIAGVENLKASGSASLAQLDALFASLQARAFSEEL